MTPRRLELPHRTDGLGVRAYGADMPPAGRAALFLDRDGVLVKDKHYMRDPADVVLMPGAVELLHWARSGGMPVAVVTNQSGIARGLLDWADFEAVDIVVACPFHPDFTPGYSAGHAHWRKPGPGMLLAAGEALDLDLPASWMIGDKRSDVDAARAAGLAGALLIRPEAEPIDSVARDVFGASNFNTAEVTTLFEAVTSLEDRITQARLADN